jgi:hypothetical protein
MSEENGDGDGSQHPQSKRKDASGHHPERLKAIHTLSLPFSGRFKRATVNGCSFLNYAAQRAILTDSPFLLYKNIMNFI